MGVDPNLPMRGPECSDGGEAVRLVYGGLGRGVRLADEPVLAR